jgi:hypothetical protein
MTVQPEDIARLERQNPAALEDFTVKLNGVTRVLTLEVNGVERNRIYLDNADDQFEMLLRLVKDQFIAWRAPKN